MNNLRGLILTSIGLILIVALYQFSPLFVYVRDVFLIMCETALAMLQIIRDMFMFAVS